MPRQGHKNAHRRQAPQPGQPAQRGGWYGGEHGNEFGGEGRFRSEGGHGSHFGGEPKSLGDGQVDRPAGQPKDPNARRGEQRLKFVEKFDRWRRERAARAARGGPDGEPAGSDPGTAGRKATK